MLYTYRKEGLEMPKFKTYNPELQLRINEAQEQYNEADRLLSILGETAKGTDEIIKLHDEAVEGLKKEKLRLEKQMMKDTQKLIRNLEVAGVNIASTEYLAGSYAVSKLTDMQNKDGNPISLEDIKGMTNQDILNHLDEYKRTYLSPVRQQLQVAMDKGTEVKQTAVEIKQEATEAVSKKGQELRDAISNIDLKLTANRAKLKFMNKVKELTQPIREKHQQFTKWRQDHGLTVDDIGKALKADKDEFVQNFSHEWQQTKNDFSQMMSDIGKAYQNYKDFNQVKHLEAERQMNMQLMSVNNRAADRCDERINKLVKRREKVINTVNKAVRLGNKIANKSRETLGFETKEPAQADVKNAKIFDKKINKLEIERVEALKRSAEYILKNNELTKQEKTISKNAMEKARGQSYKRNAKAKEQIKDAFNRNSNKESNKNFGSMGLADIFPESWKETASIDYQKKLTPNEQTLYIVDQLVPEQDVKEFIVDVSTGPDMQMDLDKASALALLYKAGVDIENDTELSDMTADELMNSLDETMELTDKEQEDFVKGADNYINSIEKDPDRTAEGISKSIINSENDLAASDIKNEVFVDKNGKETNIYLVEMNSEQLTSVLMAVNNERLRPEAERDTEFINAVLPTNNPTYASLASKDMAYKVFTKPGEAIKCVNAINRATGLDIKAIGNTEQAKSWLQNMAKEEKFANISENSIKQNVTKVESINKTDKTVKFRSDDDNMCL